MEKTKSSAPVRALAEIDIAADERGVWTVVADIASWPTWNPAVREAVFGAELEVGAKFRFATPFGRISCRLTEVDAPNTLSWKGRFLTVRQRETWRIEAGPSGTHVEIRAQMTGIGAHLFKHRLGERLQGDLDALVHLLRLEAEARSSEEREDDARAAEAERGAKRRE